MKPTRYTTAAASVLLSLATLAACGGGGSGASALPSAQAPASSSEVNKTLTADRLASCPQTSMTPVDMSKLGCLVGTISGSEYKGVAGADDTSWTPTGKSCSFSLSADGTFTGKFSTGTSTANMSPQPYVEDQAGSIYQSFEENGSREVVLATLSTPSSGAGFMSGIEDGKRFLAGIFISNPGQAMSCRMPL